MIVRKALRFQHLRNVLATTSRSPFFLMANIPDPIEGWALPFLDDASSLGASIALSALYRKGGSRRTGMDG